MVVPPLAAHGSSIVTVGLVDRLNHEAPPALCNSPAVLGTALCSRPAVLAAGIVRLRDRWKLRSWARRSLVGDVVLRALLGREVAGQRAAQVAHGVMVVNM